LAEWAAIVRGYYERLTSMWRKDGNNAHNIICIYIENSGSVRYGTSRSLHAERPDELVVAGNNNEVGPVDDPVVRSIQIPFPLWLFSCSLLLSNLLFAMPYTCATCHMPTCHNALAAL
jgi:hypothetical protein